MTENGAAQAGLVDENGQRPPVFRHGADVGNALAAAQLEREVAALDLSDAAQMAARAANLAKGGTLDESRRLAKLSKRLYDSAEHHRHRANRLESRRRPRSTLWLRMTGDVDDIERGDATCPCGGMPLGATLERCCGPVVRGELLARTPEQLMRSRYTAYAVMAHDHLFRSWHESTRPVTVEPDPWVRWNSFEVLEVVAGPRADNTAVVESRALWTVGEGAIRQTGELRERSRLVRHANQWKYLGPEESRTPRSFANASHESHVALRR